MLRRALFIASLWLSSQAAVAQQHAHGEGQLWITQQNKEWQFQFSLPAADLLGFEHIAESAEQKQKLNTQWVTNEQQGAVQLKPLSNIVRFGSQ